MSLRLAVVSEVLAETPCLGELGVDATKGQVIDLRRGECVARKGYPLAGAYVVVRGECVVLETKRRVRRPAVVNAVAAAANLTSFASVFVSEDARLVRFDPKAFRADAVESLDALLQVDVTANTKGDDDERGDDDDDWGSFSSSASSSLGPGTPLVRVKGGRRRRGFVVRELSFSEERSYYHVDFEASRHPADALERLPAWDYVDRLRTKRFKVDDDLPRRRRVVLPAAAAVRDVRYATSNQVRAWALNARAGGSFQSSWASSSSRASDARGALAANARLRPATAPTYRRPASSSGRRPTVTLKAPKTKTTSSPAPTPRTTTPTPRTKPLSARRHPAEAERFVPLAPALPPRPKSAMYGRRPSTPRLPQYDRCRRLGYGGGALLTSQEPGPATKEKTPAKRVGLTARQARIFKRAAARRGIQKRPPLPPKERACLTDLRNLEAISGIVAAQQRRRVDTQ